MIIGRYEDVHGQVLVLEADQRDDHLAVCVGYELAGEMIPSKWMHLTPQQAVEIAEMILGRWGGPNNLW